MSPNDFTLEMFESFSAEHRSQKNCWTLYSKLVKSKEKKKGAEREIFLNWKTVS